MKCFSQSNNSTRLHHVTKIPLLFGVLAFCAVCLLLPAKVNGLEPVKVWAVDIHEKIFSETKPGNADTIELKAARNEYESGQFGVCAQINLSRVTLSTTQFVHEGSTYRLPPNTLQLRPIGMIPIKRNTPEAGRVIVRRAPCEIPDVLLESRTLTLKKGESQGVWVTVFVPKDAKPGRYSATITLSAGSGKTSLKVALEVFPLTLSSERHLWVTNWFSTDYIARVHKVTKWSEEYWPILEKYFKNMAAHRQNVICTRWVPDNDFVQVTRKMNGSWNVDFSKMERYLTLAEKSGIGKRIELTSTGYLEKGKIVFHEIPYYDEKEGKILTAKAEEWLKPILGILEEWLVKTDRIDRAMIHIADEPHHSDMKSWRAASHQVHEYAPKIKRMEAIESVNFNNELEVWVPKLSHFDRWRNAFEARRNQGEIWYYLCCEPYGNFYPNRFMDLPGTRVRVLHWINYTENLCGYLHWGLNIWPDDPFGSPIEQYGPGDTHIIYPGPLDSVRWEIERESLEDYEYLVMLEKMTAQIKKESKADLWWLEPNARGMELGRRIVRSLTDTELDPKVYAKTRLDVVNEIKMLTFGPRLIVKTFPEDNSCTCNGPIIGELYGLTDPGAKVTINGKDIAVDSQGQFSYVYWWITEKHELKIVTTLNGRTTETVRQFNTKL